MKKLLLIPLFMLGSHGVWGQYTIKGKVVDKQNGTIIPGANLLIDPPGKGTSTDKNGEFEWKGLAKGEYSLLISHIGYRARRVMITVKEDTYLTLPLEQDTTGLEKVIVVGTRASLSDPVSQTNIRAEDIESLYIGQDPSVVLERSAPSIISYTDAGTDVGNYVQFRMRGIDQTRLNTTLNGVPLNDMIDQGVFFSNFSDLVNSVQSIQVQRGAGTSGNGVASYGGSVNFESKRLSRSKPYARLELLKGSFGTFRASAEANTGKLPGSLAFYSRFTRTLSNGYKDHSGSDAYSFFVSGGYLTNRNILRVTAFAGKTTNDQSYLPVLLDDIKTNPKTNYNHPNDTDDFEQELVQLQYSTILGNKAYWNTTLYYGGARGVFPFGIDNTTQLMFGLKNDHYGLMSDVNYEYGKTNLKAGMHAYTFRRENFNYTSPGISTPDYEDKTQKDEFSLFTRINYSLRAFNLYSDIQLRYVKLGFRAKEVLSFGGPVPAGGIDTGRDWLFFNPKIGVRYALGQSSFLYAAFGRTGREPTRTDILQGDGSSINEFSFASVLDASVVKEEYVNDIELGFKTTKKTYSLAINYFYMDFENEISQVGALAARSYVALRQNVPDSFRSGIEFEGNYKFSPQFSTSLLTTYLKTKVNEFDTGTEVFRSVAHIFAPRWIINPEIQWNPAKKLGLRLNGRYVSKSFMELSNDPEFELPDYFILNTTIDIRFSKHINFLLVLNNIFDELYFTDGAPVDLDFDGVVEGPGFRVQPPRNVYAMLKLNF